MQTKIKPYPSTALFFNSHIALLYDLKSVVSQRKTVIQKDTVPGAMSSPSSKILVSNNFLY